MTNKTETRSSPDFNDEFLKFGLDEFKLRLRDRLNNPVDHSAIAVQNDAEIPSEVQDWQPGEPPEDMGQNASESSAEGGPWEAMFVRGRDGPKGCSYNGVLILTHDKRWAGVLAENTFTGSIDVMRQPPIPTIGVGELDDPSVAQIHVWIEENYSIVMQDSAMRKALITVAAENRYHPVQDYLNQLPKWDGEPRCNAWLKNALGSVQEPEDYLAAIGSRFLIASVRRIMNAPEVTKVDNMLIFEGLQGDGKSTLIEELFKPWHGDTPLPLGNKDAYISIRGCWGYEMAEMDSFRKAESSTAKSFLSSHTDNYRPPFGTKNQKYPRQTVLIGTVNHIEYLVDSSGNRRYWPAWADRVNVEWLRENREQLWAEALHRCREGERHWIDKRIEPELAETVLLEQALREHSDSWEAKVAAWLWNGGATKERYTLAELFEEKGVINADIRSVTRAQEMKLSSVLQKLGFTKDRKRRNGQRFYFYVVPEGTKIGSPRPNSTPPDRGYEHDVPDFGPGEEPVYGH